VKEARNQSQIFNRKSISRNTTHRRSYHLIQMESGRLVYLFQSKYKYRAINRKNLSKKHFTNASI